MAYRPPFTISTALLSAVEAITALRERIEGATVGVSWIPALQKDARTRNVHASTAIEGNPLTLEEVRALEEGRRAAPGVPRFQREEHLLALLREHGNLAPGEIWAHLKVSRQGAMKLMKPLLEAGMIQKRGSARSGRYFLTQP